MEKEMNPSADPTSPLVSYFALVGCTSLEEVKVASEAIARHRAGEVAGPVPNDALPAPSSLANRIETALHAEPLNKQRKLLLEMLAASPAGAWLSFDTMKSKFVVNGLAETQASAALRDLSWQMGAHLPASDTAGHDAKIVVLAERSRKNGVVNYRLTPAGRIAVQAYLAA
jgi:hypothetical protein